MKNFTGRKIKSLRQKIRKSQGTIASMLGISVSAYSKIESGITDLSLSRLKQISEVFKVSMASLLEYDPREKEKDQKILQLEEDLKAVHEEMIGLQRRIITLYAEVKKYG